MNRAAGSMGSLDSAPDFLFGASPRSMASMVGGTPFGTENAAFHEKGIFTGIWLLVVFVGIHFLSSARSVLEPLLWAFFLMMGLVPLTGGIEKLLVRSCRGLGRLLHRVRSKVKGRPARAADSGSESTEEELSDEDAKTAGCCAGGADGWGGACARTVAVLITMAIFWGAVAAFMMMVLQSAHHMQESWPHYKAGGQKMSAKAQDWLQSLPSDILVKMTDKVLASAESILSGFVQTLVEQTTATLLEILMVLLYMMFWLCEPFHVGKSVSKLFKRYILLKSVASSGYAFCIWLLLHFLGVDLAIVFGLVTFVFNFVPEVGPFVAMMLPLPVILFDDRIENSLRVLCLAFMGQLGLKFVFGNIVEVKLVEAQDDMRMHPVVILFFVAFFGWIWGATGMLLSVPVMATIKATLHKVPPVYRDPFLVFLEGDRNAPRRYKESKQKESEVDAAKQKRKEAAARARGHGR